MSVDQAFLLGLVQGFTEFLPISSSGHLALLEQFLGFTTPPLAFDTLIHVATLTAVFIYFRKEIPLLLRQKFSHLVIGTVPAVVVGLLVYLFALESLFNNYLLAGGFIATSLLLYLAQQVSNTGRTLNTITFPQSFVIGVFQALALLPSISRSGATMAAGRFVGLNKQAAFTYSFVLSIPAIIGAVSLTGKDLFTAEYQFLPSLVGFVAAFISGILSLKLLDLLFKKYSLSPFIWYTFLLGVAIFGLIA